MWNNRPLNFPSHEALEDMGEDRNRRRRPTSPWGPIIVLVIIVAVIVIILTRHQTASRNTHGLSNNTASVATHAPELNIKQPLISGTLTKVSGWVPKDTGAEIHIDGPTGGSATALATQRNGYFSGTIFVPDNVPPGGTVTVTVMVENKTLINDRVKVTSPYIPQNSVELHLLH